MEHPDDFLTSLFEFSAGLVCLTVKRQRESLRKPPRTAEEMLLTLESQGLIHIVSRLRKFVDLL